jgi:hypothetical protein
LSNPNGVTRRRLLATGGIAGAAAVVGLRPWAPDAAQAAAAPASDVPAYLRRSTYLGLSTPDFTASRAGAVVGLRLLNVQDLAGDPKLAGSDDAFALEFSASNQAEQGIHTLAHPDLGTFDLFVAPVENRGGYEGVVNRSVGVPKRVPEAARPSPQPGTSAAANGAQPPTGPSAHPHTHKKHVAHVARVSARRLAGAVICEIALSADSHVKSATIWLYRGDRVVAATTVGHVHGRRIAARLRFRHRPRGGRYALAIATTDRHDAMEYKRRSITLL